jgi:hypothetical protein
MDNLIVKGYSDRDSNCFIELYDKEHNIVFRNKFLLWDNLITENVDIIQNPGGDSEATISDCYSIAIDIATRTATKIATNIFIKNIKSMMSPEILYRNCMDIYLSSIDLKQKQINNGFNEQINISSRILSKE